jgi:NDP-sugar pyrophosphorylase family protein
MLECHQNNKKWATIFVSKGWKIRVGTAEIDDNNNVTRFIEKPTLPLLVNTGISIVEPIIFDFLDDLDEKESIDLSKNIFPKFVEASQMVAYIPSNIYWEDIGSIERYEKLDGKFITQKMSE